MLAHRRAPVRRHADRVPGRIVLRAAHPRTPRAYAGSSRGRIALDRFRGRVCDPPEVQAADAWLRLELGLDAIDALQPTGVERRGIDATIVRFRAVGEGERVVGVRRVATGVERPTACGAGRVEPWRFERFEPRNH